MPASTALCEALNQGISSGIFVDTKIILYSRRDSSGRVCRPKVLYANSHVLKTVPYFQDLLFGGFAEAQSKDFKEEIDEAEFAEEYGYLSDSDLEDDEDGGPLPRNTDKSEVRSSDSVEVLGDDKVTCEDENHKQCVEKGKVVKIPDVAFLTFQAFLVYLYTSEIEFAPFGSEENRRSRNTEIADPSDDKVPRPSPKSFYRLADKYDLPQLKGRAINSLFRGLKTCDAVEESFSRFASQYEEVRDLFVRQLAFNWVETSTAEATRASIRTKIDSFVEGGLEHAPEVLSALLEIVSKDEDITAPVNTRPFIPPFFWAFTPERWPSVRTALIKSVRKGVFFDKKYWARHSKTGDHLKPVYLSSRVMEDKPHQLGKLVKYLEGQNPLSGDPEGDVDVESDCEGESPEIKEENQGRTRAVFVIGSFSAWKSLFFYNCTGVISFAPLRSQGVDSRLNYIRENTKAGRPPPCSPKSIYALAGSLGIQALCDRALRDIKSKITSENVVGEVFSPFTARQREVTEMQCDFLVQNLKNPKTSTLVGETMRRISDGSSSHCAGVLDLVLEKAFLSKRQNQGAHRV